MYRLRQLRQKRIASGRVALGVFAISMATTIGSCIFFHQWLWTAVEHRFSMDTANIELAVKMKMQVQETALWAGVGLLNSQKSMSDEVWARFIEGLSPKHLQNGVVGFGYAGETPGTLAVRPTSFGGDQKGMETRIPSRFTTARQMTSFVDGEEISVGYDLWSNKAYREAMIRARDSGILAVGNSPDASRAGGGNRLMMFVPLYDANQTPLTLTERQEQFRGFVFSPIDGFDFFEELRSVAAEGIEFELYDKGNDGLTHRIYSSAQDADEMVELSGIDTLVRQVELGGKSWILTFAATQSFVTVAERFLPLLFGVIGMLISLLLYLVTRSLGNEHQRALVLARRMSHRLLVEKDKAQTSAETEEILREGFEKACRNLQAKNDDLTRFSSIVAHDLRAPLKRIEGFVEILKEDFDTEMDEHEARDVMNRLQRSSSRMRAMIDSFQDYTKYGKPNFSHFPVRLKVLVQSLLDSMESSVKSARIMIDIDEQLEVYADTQMIETVFSNLVDNSIKFAGSNRARILISATKLPNGMVEILVRDQGIGIEPHYHGKVFDMFARLHNDDEYTGTGIGLAVCKKIIEDHSGEISVLTTPDCKTCIRFTLICYDASILDVNEAIAA